MSGFVHAVYAYRNDSEYVDGLLEFAAEPLRTGAPIRVMVPSVKVGLLMATELGSAGNVELVEIDEIGRNPGRIISSWLDFIERHRQAPRVWGVGEPIWQGRSEAEIDECLHNEQLLNLAFEGLSIELLCPYDAAGLPHAVLLEAQRSHPHLGIGARMSASRRFSPSLDRLATLTPTPSDAERHEFDGPAVSSVRRTIERHARERGLDHGRTVDLVLSASEIASNSVQYAAGGTLTMWSDDAHLVCQFDDSGRIPDPMTGRRRPSIDADSGRGVWLANQLCDLVQIRTGESGTTVRLSMRHSPAV